MTYQENFIDLLGTLTGDERAYVYEMSIGEADPFKSISRHIPNGAKIAIRNRVVYIKASSFTHTSRQELQL